MMTMKKVLLFAAVILFAACGEDESSSSMVKKAISAAEKTVVVEESKNLGAVPSLQLQYREAEKQVKVLLEEFNKKAEEKFKKGGSMEDAIRAEMILKDLKKETKQELETIYKEKIMAESSKLEGKSVAVDFDKDQFASATAVLHVAADSSISKPYSIAAELKLAKPIAYTGWTWFVYANWECIGTEGEKLGNGSESIENFKELKADDIISFEIKPYSVPSGENGKKFDKIYFKINK